LHEPGHPCTLCLLHLILSIVFGSPPRTLCLLCFIPLASTIPYGSVFSISTSLAMQDDTMHPWYKGPCVIHSKLLSMNATKQDRVSYWTNNKDNQTRPGARFEHASHNPGLPLHPGSPSPKQPITLFVSIGCPGLPSLPRLLHLPTPPPAACPFATATLARLLLLRTLLHLRMPARPPTATTHAAMPAGTTSSSCARFPRLLMKILAI